MNSLTVLDQFYRTRDEYRNNANKAIAALEYRKASELLWGAISQQIKALAATRNVLIETHRQFFDFMRQFAKESEDPGLYEEFVALNALHRNFYDEIIPTDLFPKYCERALNLVQKLDEITRANH